MLVLLFSFLSYKSIRKSKNLVTNLQCQPDEVLTTVTEQTGSEMVKVRRPCWTLKCPDQYDFVPIYKTITKCVKAYRASY